MKDSATYEAILDKGKAEGEEAGVRAAIRRIGTKRYGPPSLETEEALENVHDFEDLETLAERLLEAENWNELMNPLEI
jgi:hypothetical protein